MAFSRPSTGPYCWPRCACRPPPASSSRKWIWLALLAFPGTILGAWLGARTYHALSDRNFRDVVLGLLFLSGVGLVWSGLVIR